MSAETSNSCNWAVLGAALIVARRAMGIRSRLRHGVGVLVFAAAGLLPALAAANDVIATAQSDTWQFSSTVYGWLPDLHGTVNFPVLGTTQDISVDANTLLNHVNLAAMGAFDVHHGAWGAFTDVMYMNLGAHKSNTRDFTIGNIGIPATTTADLRMSVKQWMVTIAPEYRLVADPAWILDLYVGVRYLSLSNTLDWSITGALGPLPPANRTGSSEANVDIWDGIIGVKGQYAFGTDRRWSVPFYLDGGTGDSWNTFQVAGGVAYAFSWGQIGALYRYLEYKPQGSNNNVQKVSFNGPMVGATLRW
jgi:hypothetical protein